LHSGGQQFDPA